MGRRNKQGEKQAAVQQAEDPECRLCGGCHKAKSREEFAAHEWQKADAWSREAARQCQECVLTSAQSPEKGERQGRRTSKRAAASRGQREEQEDGSEECNGRQLDQVLCPRGCKCGNALPASGRPEIVRVVQGGGRACGERSHGHSTH